MTDKQNKFRDALEHDFNLTSKEYLKEHQYTVIQALQICAELVDELDIWQELAQAGDRE